MIASTVANKNHSIMSKAEDPYKAVNLVSKEIESWKTGTKYQATQIAQRFNAYSPEEREAYLSSLKQELEKHINFLGPLLRRFHRDRPAYIGRTNRQTDNFQMVLDATMREIEKEKQPKTAEIKLTLIHKVLIAFYEGRLDYEQEGIKKGEICKREAERIGNSATTIQRKLSIIERDRFDPSFKIRIQKILTYLTPEARKRAEDELDNQRNKN